MKQINKQMRPTLPPSLKKRRVFKILFRICSCLLLLAIFITIIILWGNRLFPSSDYPQLKIIFYIIILCIPFLSTGVPLKLIDSSWSGTITNVEIKENLGTTSCPAHVHLYPKEDLIITITKDNGKILKHTILSLVEKNNNGTKRTPIGKAFYHEHKYKIGDRVHKYYGFKHLYFIPHSYHNTKDCIICGSKNDINDHICWYCNSELISKQEIENL